MKSFTELGDIMLANYPVAALLHGYQLTDPDPWDIGEQALLWGDIDEDGMLA